MGPAQCVVLVHPVRFQFHYPFSKVRGGIVHHLTPSGSHASTRSRTLHLRPQPPTRKNISSRKLRRMSTHPCDCGAPRPLRTQILAAFGNHSKNAHVAPRWMRTLAVSRLKLRAEDDATDGDGGGKSGDGDGDLRDRDLCAGDRLAGEEGGQVLLDGRLGRRALGVGEGGRRG